jgi:acyl-CoA dehydrogenase
MWVSLRTLRLADGPDEVHEAQVGRMESRRGRNGASERAAKL